jgi:hypothetical protein
MEIANMPAIKIQIAEQMDLLDRELAGVIGLIKITFNLLAIILQAFGLNAQIQLGRNSKKHAKKVV